MHLREHYRSHPDIIAFCNREFYNGELIPSADPAIADSFLNRDILVNPAFPIVFHGLSGKDEREESSPSFFNRVEALEVKKYVAQLMADKKLRLSKRLVVNYVVSYSSSTEEENIGVISPYFGQCCKIKKLLEEWQDIKVGSVEEFQGQVSYFIYCTYWQAEIVSALSGAASYHNFDSSQ